MLQHVSLAGLKIATASRAVLTETMLVDCRARARAMNPSPPLLLFDANGHAVSLATSDQRYCDALDRADLVHADGGFLVTASRWLAEVKIAERSATTDLIHDFAAAAAASGLSFYLLGGTEEVNRSCAMKLQELYPGLKIAGRRDGYFTAQDVDEVIEAINAVSPNLLWIGLGKPLEQIFAADNAFRLRAGWAVTCGGCFDFVAGKYLRAPSWMQRMNLEWLFRALTEKRLLWRYLTTSPHALWLTFTRSGRAKKCPREDQLNRR